MKYLANLGIRRTRQSEPLLGRNQVRNSAGGYTWAVDDWVRLDRFLILGSEGGSYYAREQELTRENAVAVLRAIEADGPRTVARIVEVSEGGRAPRNDPAIFALALAASLGDEATRREAFAALPHVCRIGTHLMHFAQYVEGFRGWGRGLRKAIAGWYAQPAPDLALQAVKYQQRDGWSHRDLLRLAHPVAVTPEHQTIYHWITRGWDEVGAAPHSDPALRSIWAFERAKRATSAAEIVELIRAYRLPREAVPTEWLADPAVWEALLDDMPMTALIRNLATMTRVGLLAANSQATARVVAQLRDGERLRRARVHPIAVLAALKTYAQGRGERGKSTWEPVQRVVDALDAAFYTAFKSVEPTGKRWLLALDVSGSMSMGQVAGVPGLTPRVASAAMALVTAATEPAHEFLGFCDELVRLRISPRQRLDDVVKATDNLPFGGTDCALPMVWATKHRVAVDVFAIYTDGETWYGDIHPAQALNEYRERMGIPARLVVVGMVANRFTIADPEDAGMLDVVGFDTATPPLIADFARG
jgi:60 kDa SS-A/Ro ribonucleoprotein